MAFAVSRHSRDINLIFIEDRNIKLHLSMEDIRKGIEQTLSNYFQTVSSFSVVFS
jgi:hypothetical protein